MNLPPPLVERVLGTFEVFGPADSARAFVERGEAMKLAAGERVVEEQDASRDVYAVLEGTLGVFYSAPDGTNMLVKLFAPPAIFGEMELPFALPRMEYVELFEPSLLVRWPGDLFLDYLRGNAQAAFAMFVDISARLCISAYLERALAFQDVETRLAGLFLSLLDVRGPAPAPVELPLQLSYQAIARCLAVTPKSVERTVGGWLREGWLERHRSRYLVTDLEALAKKADPDLLLLHSRLGRGPRAIPAQRAKVRQASSSRR